MQRDPELILTEFLVLRCQNGDRDALGQLVELWHKPLLRIACRRTQDADAAADLLQETWLAACRGLARLKDPSRFPGWISGILAHKATDWVRQQQSRRRVFDSLTNVSRTEHSAPPMPEQSTRETIGELRTALRQLDDDHRTVLEMFYLDGWSVALIGQVLHVPPGTVKSRLFHARKKLRDMLDTGES